MNRFVTVTAFAMACLMISCPASLAGQPTLFGTAIASEWSQGVTQDEEETASPEVTAFEILRLAEGGASVTVDSRYSAYDVLRIAKKGKGRVAVKADGFLAYDLIRIASTGAKILGVEGHVSAYDLLQIAEAGGSVVIGNRLSAYDVLRIVEAGEDRVFVDCAGFTTYDAMRFARAGARLLLDSSFSSYDLARITEAGRDHAAVRKSSAPSSLSREGLSKLRRLLQ